MIWRMSRIAAPVGEVTMPIFWGREGRGFLRAGLVYGQPSIPHDLKAVFGLEFQEPILHPEHDRADLGGFILQGAVKVAGAGNPEVGDLPLHPEVLKVPLQEALDLRGQLGDG
jgi:hypothetical protein